MSEEARQAALEALADEGGKLAEYSADRAAEVAADWRRRCNESWHELGKAVREYLPHAVAAWDGEAPADFDPSGPHLVEVFPFPGCGPVRAVMTRQPTRAWSLGYWNGDAVAAGCKQYQVPTVFLAGPSRPEPSVPRYFADYRAALAACRTTREAYTRALAQCPARSS